MSRKIIKFFLMIVTVLTVNLLTDYLVNYLMEFKDKMNPLYVTAIGMLISVVILVPAFSYIDSWMGVIIKKMLQSGKHFFGKTFGVFLFFVVTLFILYCIYAAQWFDINVPKMIFHR